MGNNAKKNYSLNETLARHELNMNRKAYTKKLCELRRYLDTLRQEKDEINNVFKNLNTLPYEEIIHPDGMTKEDTIDEFKFRLKWNLIHTENVEKEIDKYENKLKQIFHNINDQING